MLTNEQITLLTEKYIDTVYRVALGYTRNSADAEDVTQNVFLALLRNQPALESDDHARFWLIRVTVNECKKLFRSPWHGMAALEDYAGSLPFAKQAHSDLFFAVMALPTKYRMPIYLYYYEEYSTEEIASLLKMPKGTVCTNLKRGRELLKKEMEEDHNG